MNLYLNIKERIRIRLYKRYSSKTVTVTGKPVLNQPLLIKGEGKVRFEPGVSIGYPLSQGYYNTYTYFDLRGSASMISVGEGVKLNNNTCLTADEASIHIGKNTVAGVNLSIQTSDGHCLSPAKRHQGNFPKYSVIIGENVFIGDNVIILKGVKIGRNSVIGAGSVVTHDIPENVMAAGNPCHEIRPLS
ncbi:MAG: DapH/DapD/GlmU-related protein [Bacteroidota bacterium]|nr:DapH/DapD/GlmU-related protein [Bacteroidota bacterium]